MQDTGLFEFSVTDLNTDETFIVLQPELGVDSAHELPEEKPLVLPAWEYTPRYYATYRNDGELMACFGCGRKVRYGSEKDGYPETFATTRGWVIRCRRCYGKPEGLIGRTGGSHPHPNPGEELDPAWLDGFEEKPATEGIELPYGDCTRIKGIAWNDLEFRDGDRITYSTSWYDYKTNRQLQGRKVTTIIEAWQWIHPAHPNEVNHFLQTRDDDGKLGRVYCNRDKPAHASEEEVALGAAPVGGMF